MKHLAVLLVIGLMLVLVSCDKATTKPASIPPEPSQVPNENGNVKHKEDEITTRSARWKTQQRVEDFLWLVEHAIPTGSSKSHVRKLLGEPLEHVEVSQGAFWRYIKCDAEKKQYEALSVIFDKNGKVHGLGRKPID